MKTVQEIIEYALTVSCQFYGERLPAHVGPAAARALNALARTEEGNHAVDGPMHTEAPYIYADGHLYHAEARAHDLLRGGRLREWDALQNTLIPESADWNAYAALAYQREDLSADALAHVTTYRSRREREGATLRRSDTPNTH